MDENLKRPTEEENQQGSSATLRPQYSHNRAIRAIQVIRDLGNEVAIIRIKWLVGGMLIFLFSVILTQVQFNGSNDDARARDKHTLEQQRLRDNYVYALVDWNSATAAEKLCIDGVERSDLNRAQHRLIADTVEALGGEEAEAFAQELRDGPLLSSEPRSLDECIDPGPKPIPPDQLAVDEAASFITSTTTGDTTP